LHNAVFYDFQFVIQQDFTPFWGLHDGYLFLRKYRIWMRGVEVVGEAKLYPLARYNALSRYSPFFSSILKLSPSCPKMSSLADGSRS